jgi:tetratricopeptide (TPR) repeat protein
LSLIASLATLFAQGRSEALRSLEVIPFEARIENALVSYVTYVIKAVWPTGLAVFYPHPMSYGTMAWGGAAIFLAVATILILRRAASHGYLAAGWLWFLGTLFPVIGVVQVGFQARADRYAYLPLIGLFIAAVWGVTDLFRHWRVRQSIAGILGCSVLFAALLGTLAQIPYWKNSATLFRRALEVTHDNYVAHFSLALFASERGATEEADAHFNKAIELNPGYVALMLNRAGKRLVEQGRAAEAESLFRVAAELAPGTGTPPLRSGDN